MTTEKNKQIVGQFFERFSAADVAGALDLVDAAVVWRAMGREGGLPMSGEMDRQVIGGLIENVKAAFPEGMKLTPNWLDCRRRSRCCRDRIVCGENEWNGLQQFLSLHGDRL